MFAGVKGQRRKGMGGEREEEKKNGEGRRNIIKVENMDEQVKGDRKVRGKD